MTKVLIPMDMPNVFRECKPEVRDNLRNANAKVHPFMVPLITELSKRRPLWTFVSVSHHSHGADNIGYFYSRFSVRVGDEEIGVIQRDLAWRDHTESFEFDCRQLRAKRTRGASNKTKNLKKAVKLITDSFAEMSYAEHANRTVALANQAMYRQMVGRQSTFSRLEAEARPSVMAFLKTNWAQFIDSLGATERSKFADLMELYEAAVAARIMDDGMGKVGTYVWQMGDKYVVKEAGSDDVLVLTNQTLPDALRGPIGMLKLVEDDTMIDGIGARGGEGAFYIVPAESSDE